VKVGGSPRLPRVLRQDCAACVGRGGSDMQNSMSVRSAHQGPRTSTQGACRQGSRETRKGTPPARRAAYASQSTRENFLAHGCLTKLTWAACELLHVGLAPRSEVPCGDGGVRTAPRSPYTTATGKGQPEDEAQAKSGSAETSILLRQQLKKKPRAA